MTSRTTTPTQGEPSFQPQGSSTPANRRGSNPEAHPEPSVSPGNVTTMVDSLLVPGATLVNGRLVIPFLQRRSIVARYPDLDELQAHYLAEGLRILRQGEPSPRRLLTTQDEESLSTELYLLDQVIEGIPVYTDINDTEDKSGMLYHPNVNMYGQLMSAMIPMLNVVNKYLRYKGLDDIEMPIWGWSNDLTGTFEEKAYAEIAAVFREDVENFFTYAMHPSEAPQHGSPFGNKTRVAVPEPRDPFVQDRYVSPSPKPPTPRPAERYTIPALRSPRSQPPPVTGTNATPLGNRVRLAPTVPEVIEETFVDESRLDMHELREELAQARTPAARARPETNSQHYGRVGKSRRLTELFADPPFVGSPRPDEAVQPTRPSQTRYRDLADIPEDDPDYPFAPTPRAVRGGNPQTRPGVSLPHLNPNIGRGNARAAPLAAPVQVQAPMNAPADLQTTKIPVPHFDVKLKVDQIEEWDGDSKTMIDWFEGVNTLAGRSSVVYDQLGTLVPTRFTKKAKAWWHSLTLDRRRLVSQDWGTLRRAIAQYYMGRRWFDELRLEAKNCQYRDSKAPNETPSEYFIRKFKLLDTAEEYSDSLMIMTIMDGAPRYWHAIIDTMSLETPADLQDKIQYHEDALRHSPMDQNTSVRALENRIRALEGTRRPNNFQPRRFPPRTGAQANLAESADDSYDDSEAVWANANLVGWAKDLPKPTYPRDDATKSKGKSPEDKGARPCRHCGSPKHWDNECRYAKKGTKVARANLSTASDDYWQALDEYEAVYCDSSSEGEEEASSEPLN